MNDAVTAMATAAAAAAADHRVAAKCARTNQFNLGNFQVVPSRENEREEKRKWRLILRRLATSVRGPRFSQSSTNVRLQSPPAPPKERVLSTLPPRCCPRHCKYFRLNSHLIFINGDGCAQHTRCYASHSPASFPSAITVAARKGRKSDIRDSQSINHRSAADAGTMPPVIV